MPGTRWKGRARRSPLAGSEDGDRVDDQPGGAGDARRRQDKHENPRTSLSVAELARRAGVTRQTMHRAVTQLVGEGLLTRAPGPGFPRSTLSDRPTRGLDVVTSPWEFSATWNKISAVNWGPRRRRSCATD
ncbi:MarR family transcriptional regulator [Streptomyces sp. NBC_00111]|uniref:MarR family transcriptional regulator n=1 Tax=unclassified Streptomyces TaxID=2593676 RepID=UPI002E2EB6A2|nr:helix-turn-helix domain-containing protein [Streptomyces sp. NBC_01460]